MFGNSSSQGELIQLLMVQRLLMIEMEQSQWLLLEQIMIQIMESWPGSILLTYTVGDTANLTSVLYRNSYCTQACIQPIWGWDPGQKVTATPSDTAGVYVHTIPISSFSKHCRFYGMTIGSL